MRQYRPAVVVYDIHEIIGKPYDLDEIVVAVRHAVGRTVKSKPSP